MPLRAALADALREHLARRIPTSPAFAIPTNWRQAEMLAADLEAAGVAVVDDENRFADFHALRHTFITNLSRAGVNPKTAQSLARHSSIVLTMDHYTHLRVDDDRRALELLPRIDAPQLQELPATGTDGASVLSLCLSLLGGSPQTSVDSSSGLAHQYRDRTQREWRNWQTRET